VILAGPWLAALVGGALIGVAASLLWLTHGRVAGVSGILGGLVRPGPTDQGFRVAFLSGLVLGGLALRFLLPSAFVASSVVSGASRLEGSVVGLVAAGLLVGFGTQLGSGCTSGHGVCGVSRWSRRSLVATGAFMLTGFAATFVVRHLASAGRG